MASVPIIDAEANPDKDPVIYGLAARRSEVAGLIERLQGQVESAKADLATLDPALALWGVDNPDTCIRTKKATTAGLFHPKELPRLVRDCLRKQPEGATSRQIAEYVITAKAWDYDENLHTALAQKIARLMCEWKRQGRF